MTEHPFSPNRDLHGNNDAIDVAQEVLMKSLFFLSLVLFVVGLPNRAGQLVRAVVFAPPTILNVFTTTEYRSYVDNYHW